MANSGVISNADPHSGERHNQTPFKGQLRWKAAPMGWCLWGVCLGVPSAQREISSFIWGWHRHHDFLHLAFGCKRAGGGGTEVENCWCWGMGGVGLHPCQSISQKWRERRTAAVEINVHLKVQHRWLVNPLKWCCSFMTPFQSPGIGLQDNFTGDLLVLLGSSTG